jgi:AraC-like DNA-binding protein
MYLLCYQLIGCKIGVIVAKKTLEFLPMGITQNLETGSNDKAFLRQEWEQVKTRRFEVCLPLLSFYPSGILPSYRKSRPSKKNNLLSSTLTFLAQRMPLYMDVHIVPGVKARDVAAAHEMDLVHQHEHGCTAMTYWVDENRGSVFCLVEAPDAQSVEAMHRQAHGLIPHKVIEVNTSLVDSFLGRIYDPENAKVGDDGLKVFEDASYRVLLVTETTDRVLLHHQFGIDATNELLQKLNDIIRKNLAQYQGREAEHRGDGFIISFTSAKQASNCAYAIQNDLVNAGLHIPGFKMALHAGEPVEHTDLLFGDTIRLALQLCKIASDHQLAISSAVQELLANEPLPKRSKQVCMLSPQDERMLEQLFTSLEANWQDADFDMEEYCQTVTMSKSALYRKSISLTGLSPNTLLMQFRLEKAKELMRQQRYSISQITFDAGFSSPSYFTKCFKKKFGLLPMAYLELLP